MIRTLMPRLLLLSLIFTLYAKVGFAQDKPKKATYASSVDFLLGYELPAVNFISTLPTNNFSKLPQPAPSLGIQFTAKGSKAVEFVFQFYHSYYPFEHDYNDYASVQNIKQFGMYFGPALKFGRTKFVVELTAMPGFILVENSEFFFTKTPGYSDFQPNELVLFSAKGMLDLRYQLYHQLALKFGVAYTYCHYDVKVDNDVPTFFNDRMTPFIGICALVK